MRGRKLMARLLATAVAAASCGAAATADLTDPPRAEAAPLVVADWDPTPRPLGPITVLGDSVLKGSLETSPSLVDRLAEQGWGPIRARAGGGYSTGQWETGNRETKATYWIDVWRAQGWNPADVLINLGANDAGMCQTSACAYRMITFLADHIGPGHRIWWPLITHLGAGRAAAWNAALRQVAAERTNFFIWDWPAEMQTGGYSSGDGVHLGPESYRKRSVAMAQAITAALGSASPTGRTTPFATLHAAPTDFVPLTSTRVLDTRLPAEAPAGPVAGDTHVTIDVAGAVPAGTQAVALYVAATQPQGSGFVTAFPCNQTRPAASNANYAPGATRGAVTIVPVVDGHVCLFTKATAHLVADVQGAFVAPGHENALRLRPLATPERLADTRPTTPLETLEVAVPGGASAAAFNLTAVGHAEPGYLTAYPCDAERPQAAAVNFGAGETAAAAAYVPVGADGTVCVFTKGGADVIVDLTATFAPAGGPGGLQFVPNAPLRTVDTRDGIGGWFPVHGPGQTIDAPVAPNGARAVSGTLTLSAPVAAGYLRAWGCGTEPPTSNVNAVAGATFANHVTTGLGDAGRLCIFSLARGNTIFDTTGWWVDPT